VNYLRSRGLLTQLALRATLAWRHIGRNPASHSFNQDRDSDRISRIYVINLDRAGDRWQKMQHELARMRSARGTPLGSMTRRLPAVDARDDAHLHGPGNVSPDYSLADQLFVDPDPSINGRREANEHLVLMTRQEIAVALSHVAVWRLIAAGDCPYTLVLEDDVYFRRGFAQALDRAWEELADRRLLPFDVLYLSYEEARSGARKLPVSDALFSPVSGLWQLSGYVLSGRGARKLLNALPVRGPVDLWLNHQYAHLEVFATHRPLIEQRVDLKSANVHSILPVLSQVGVFTREKPLLAKLRTAPAPIFALGAEGSGTTSLAMALSMLRYRCCSDIRQLPTVEQTKLFGRGRGRMFQRLHRRLGKNV
jgi:GR25 family glycosyltransferase involved in LPS biosynthesis